MLTVKFNNNKLEDCYTDSKKAIKKWGRDVAVKYIMRIDAIKAANSIDDLYKIPQLRFHPLKGERKGQYAIDLTGKDRLIVKILDNNTIKILKVSTTHYE